MTVKIKLTSTPEDILMNSRGLLEVKCSVSIDQVVVNDWRIFEDVVLMPDGENQVRLTGRVTASLLNSAQLPISFSLPYERVMREITAVLPGLERDHRQTKMTSRYAHALAKSRLVRALRYRDELIATSVPNTFKYI